MSVVIIAFPALRVVCITFIIYSPTELEMRNGEKKDTDKSVPQTATHSSMVAT